MGMIQPPKTTDKRLQDVENNIAEILKIILKVIEANKQQQGLNASLTKILQVVETKLDAVTKDVENLKGDGKCVRVYFYEQLNFYGKRVIQLIQPNKKR
jgi:hypothetical protein